MNCVLVPQPDGLHRCEACGFTRQLTVAPERYRRRCPGKASEKPTSPNLTKPCGTCGPGLLKTAANAVAAAGRAIGAAVTGQAVLVDAATKTARLATCNRCELLAGNRCDACGCFVEAKAALATEDCPLGRWARSLQTAQRPLFRLTHGLGDAVQFTVALRHLRHYFPGQRIAVQVADATVPLFVPLVDTVYRESDRPDLGDHDYVDVVSWKEPIRTYPDSPATKAEHWLHAHGLRPLPELCRYESKPRAEAMAAAAEYLAECDATGRAILVHHTGRTARNRKTLPDVVWLTLLERLKLAGYVPIVLDWECHGRPGCTVGVRGTFNPGRRHWLWHGWDLGDAERIAALAALATACVGIDSGPGHIFETTDTPTVIAWARNHPIHYAPLSDTTLHLVPHDHARWAKGSLDYFAAHYSYRVYSWDTLPEELSQAVLDQARYGRTTTADPVLKSLPHELDSDLRISDAHEVAWQASAEQIEYGQAYWDKYMDYAKTERGAVLRRLRDDLAAKYARSVLDLGIGCGDFVQHWTGGPAYGWDVSEQARNWLAARDALLEPNATNLARVQAVTAWDTFEHLPQPSKLLDAMHAGQYLILSLPIFDDLRRIRESRHYRPGEHLTYWTTSGLRKFLDRAGFTLLESNDRETREADREAIQSFVFRKRPYAAPVKSALITGGIGDWLAIEQLLTGEQRDALETVYYATRAHQAISDIWRLLPNYPRLREHVVLWDDWSKRFCFTSRWELAKELGRELPVESDWSIRLVFAQHERGEIQCRQSSLLRHTLADLPGGLPAEYLAIQSESPNDRRLPRDVRDGERPKIDAWASLRGLPLVSLDMGAGLSLPAAIETLKRADGFIGIDSCFSVLAARLFDPHMLKIRSVNQHLFKNVRNYYPTQEAGPWLSKTFD